MNIKTALKTTVAATALFAVASPAFAGNVVSGNDNFSVKLSGQFNKAMSYVDSGPASGFSVGDNTISETRLWVTPSGTINEALSVNGRIEIRTYGNRLNDTGIAGTDRGTKDEYAGASGLTLTETWMAINHKSLGSIQLGTGSQATDGAGESAFNPAGSAIDTGSIEFNDIEAFASGATGTTAPGTTTVASFFSDYQGGDTDNISYITPTIAGFQGKVSTGDNITDAAVYYGGKFGSFEVQADFGYVAASGAGTNEYTLTTAGGVKHDSGFSLSGGYGKEKGETSGSVDGKLWFIIGGYEANLTSMGKTGFAVQYLVHKNKTVQDDEGKVLSVGVQQGLATGVQVYASANFFEMEAPGTDYEDVTAFLAGAKVSF